MAHLTNRTLHHIQLKRGLDANVIKTATIYGGYPAEPLWTTDTNRLFITDGNGGIIEYDKAPPLSQPPTTTATITDEFTGTSLDGKWTVFNSHANFAITVGNGLLTFNDNASPSGLRGVTQPLPTAPYDIRTKLNYGRNTYWAGMILKRSSDDYAVGNGYYMVSHSADYVSFTPAASGITLEDAPFTGSVWLRIVDDGTLRKCYYSMNGIHWNIYVAVSNTATITPNQVGLAMLSAGGGAYTEFSFEWFRQY